MTVTWDDRVARFWASVEAESPDAVLDSMAALVAQRPVDDPDALYESASVHDYLGREQEAVSLYKIALDRGLSGSRKQQAIIQLASSLRNIGDPQAAVDLLREHPSDEITGDAAQAFLALALRDSGRPDEALRTALVALSRTLPMYRSAVERYANELLGETNE